jgi:hypothetical protein
MKSLILLFNDQIMKKILFITFVFGILASGCALLDDGNQYVAVKSEFKTRSECSEYNPPKTYIKEEKDDHSSQMLDLCDYKTNYDAVEFEDQGFILFADPGFYDGSNSETQTVQLKIISTVAPFNIEHIGNLPDKTYANFSGYGDYNTPNFSEGDWHVWAGGYGEMYGLNYYLFAFSPKTKEFISSGIGGDWATLKFISNDGEFSAKDYERIHDMYSFRSFCGPLNMHKSHIDNPDYQQAVSDFVKGFPNKIYCYKDFDYWRENAEEGGDEIVGYFDLLNDKFVQTD